MIRVLLRIVCFNCDHPREFFCLPCCSCTFFTDSVCTLHVFIAGMVVFKLERERPAMDVCTSSASKQVFYYKDRHIRIFDVKSHKDLPIAAIRTNFSSCFWFDKI